MSFFRNLCGRRREGLIHRLSKGCRDKFLMLLLLSSCICYFVIFNLAPNRKTFQTLKHISATTDATALLQWMDSLAFIHLNSASNMADNNATFLMIFPYSIKQDNISQELKENDKSSLWKLYRFLGSMKEFHGATCLKESLTHSTESDSTSDYRPKHKRGKPTGNTSLDSSWCRFITKKWSVHIRNTGPVRNIQLQNFLPGPESNGSLDKELSTIQSCNILQGPFMIRKDIFHKLGGLLAGFGRMTLLEFFLRSKGELKMTKLANCVWTPEIMRADRGALEGSNEVPEYAFFAL